MPPHADVLQWDKDEIMITPEQLAASGSEHGHQAALFCWAALNVNRFSQLRLMFAIPNGGLRDKVTASRMRAEGVKSGVPDIFLPVSMGCYHGLFIEMKIYNKNGKKTYLSDDQQQMRNDLIRQGYAFAVCYTWQEAATAIEMYIDGKF